MWFVFLFFALVPILPSSVPIQAVNSGREQIPVLTFSYCVSIVRWALSKEKRQHSHYPKAHKLFLKSCILMSTENCKIFYGKFSLGRKAESRPNAGMSGRCKTFPSKLFVFSLRFGKMWLCGKVPL